ncbi:hypothetical protein WJX72_009642 [[Myrmecia] bisecta]|uniref:Uncharacterized protein n=1 Tax=[Myrmecia] bisecta TaxID=41462 RepID=A0AAW1QG33_9CHLO
MDRHNNGPGTDLGPGSGADAQGYIEQVLGMTRPPRSRNSLACTTAGGCEGGGATGIHALEVPDSPSFQSQYQTSHEELGLSLENAADWLDDEIALPGGLQAPTLSMYASPMRGRSSSSLSGSPSPAEWAAPVSAPMAGMQMQVQPRSPLHSDRNATNLRPPLLEAFKRKADFVEEFDMGTDAEDDSDNNIDSGESMEEWLDRRAACTNKPKRALQKGRSTRAGASRNCDPSWPPPLQAQRGGWLKRVVTPTAAALAMAEAQEAADSPEERQGVHRRKHHNPWTVEETQALIDGVEGCGGGKWSQIKKMAPPVLAQRSAVDLKDKWRNLMRIAIPPAGTPPPSKSGDRKRDVPQELLARVRELAPLIGKKPGPEARYAAYAAATALRRRVR